MEATDEDSERLQAFELSYMLPNATYYKRNGWTSLQTTIAIH